MDRKYSTNKKATMRTNDSVKFYVDELTSRVVAKSGIPSDRYHLGKIILQSLRDDPSFLLQIDGALDKSETNGSVLDRSIRCAVALKSLGLQLGDVIIIMAPNHVDLCLPMYAGYYLGLSTSGIDRTLGVQELSHTFNSIKPKAVFCQTEKTADIEAALNDSNTDALIVTFDKGTYCYFGDLLMNVDQAEVENFKPTEFDPEETIGLLTTSSGTTGLPKSAALTHKSLLIAFMGFHCRFYFPNPIRLFFFISPIQWLSAQVTFTMSPILRYTRLQTADATKQHIFNLITTYKPTTVLSSPNLMYTLVSPLSECCDFSSFDSIILGGSAVTQDVIDKTRLAAPQAEVMVAYGCSETAGLSFSWDPELPEGSVGRPLGYLRYRIVNPDTLKDIEKPNEVGELWVTGPTLLKGYYRNPEATKQAIAEGCWFKTGDLFYRDQYHHYFFVDRLKMLLKYQNHQISPIEVENVIRTHPNVLDVAVVGVPDPKCGELPAAVVVTKQGTLVSAQEIKNLVKENLTDTKQLRGGVVFMKELPLTAATKLDRLKLKKMVPSMNRE